MKKAELLEKLNIPDAFADFVPLEKSVLGGWHSDSNVFGFLIESVKPQLIIEVGSFVGFSTATMAKHLERLGLDCTILCVDTWLGSLEYWRDSESQRDSGLQFVHGYPQWYFSFLTNITWAKQAHRVVPLPLPSLIAARLLIEKKIQADLVYIDASHDEDDVYNDLVAYWKVVSNRGGMFGDDWQWDSVRSAVERFATENTLQVQHDDINWIIQKHS